MGDPDTDFITAFLAAEHGAHVAQHSERDDTAYEAACAAVQRFFEAGDELSPAWTYVEQQLQRPQPADAEWFDLGAQGLPHLRARPLFQLKKYAHPDLGAVVRYYVGGNVGPAGRPGRYILNLISREHGRGHVHGRQLVSVFHVDHELDVLGTALDHWSFRDGLPLEHLGQLRAVVKFCEPGWPVHRAEYDAE